MLKRENPKVSCSKSRPKPLVFPPQHTHTACVYKSHTHTQPVSIDTHAACVYKSQFFSKKTSRETKTSRGKILCLFLCSCAPCLVFVLFPAGFSSISVICVLFPAVFGSLPLILCCVLCPAGLVLFPAATVASPPVVATRPHPLTPTPRYVRMPKNKPQPKP